MKNTHSETYTVRNYQVGPYGAVHVRTLLQLEDRIASYYINLRRVGAKTEKTAADVQADPEDRATSSTPIIRLSPSTPGKLTFRLPGSR